MESYRLSIAATIYARNNPLYSLGILEGLLLPLISLSLLPYSTLLVAKELDPLS